MSTKYFDYLPTYQQNLEKYLFIDELAKRIETSRKLLVINPNSAGVEVRIMLEESMRQIAMKRGGMRKKELGDLSEVIYKLKENYLITDQQEKLFSVIRKKANKAAHQSIDSNTAEEILVLWDNALRTILKQQGKNVIMTETINDTMSLTTYATFDRKLIYIQSANTESGGYNAYIGLEKIGDASVPDDWEADFQPNSEYLRTYAKKRINQYMTTAGVPYVLHWAQLAVNKKGFFRDHDVHQVLKKSGYNPVSLGKDDNGRALEWFKVSVEIAKKAIEAVKDGKASLSPNDLVTEAESIKFRPEQRNAIDQTVKVFKKHKEMLWNAKMRFGKTLTSLQVMKECGYKKVLIITHRPVVSDGWFEDFHKIFPDGSTLFGSRKKGETIDNLVNQDKNFIYFASIQDLRESTWAGGKYDKNHKVAETEWDCIIIDEAHEGNETELAQQMKRCLVKEETRILELSGTPFNLMDKYDEDNIYTWDYTMEQAAKESWEQEHPGEPNPYSSLPKVLMYTFDVAKQFKFIDEQKSFNFKEFFRVEAERPLQFVHQTEVERFLNYITTNDKQNNFPFSTKEFRQNLRHTLWVLPGIKEANALEQLLKNHPVFEAYKIVNVVKGDMEEESQEGQDDALALVREAIGSDPSQTKTITLTVRKLTTGVNVPEWTGVMFLSNTESPTTYLQAAFRAQTPFNHEKLGVKQQCYIFDFAPDRALKIMSESVGLTSKKGKINSTEQKSKLGKLLNFLPVLGQAGHGMKPFNVDKMLTQLKKVYAEKAVKTGFEDNSLYNDHLLHLDEVELNQFADLKQIVGKSGNKKKDKQNVIVNQTGLDKEQYDKAVEAEKKPKRQRTEEEKELIEQAKKAREQRRTMISILRGVSIRIPMLIYGMDVDIDEDITLDKFIELVDEASWEEFMPKGLTKGKFRTFTKYYDAEVFIEAGRIIRRKAKSYDKLDFIERTEKIAQLFSPFKNPDKETVLTPWKVVNRQIVSTIGGYSFYDEQFENDTIEGRSANHWVEQADTEAIYHPQTRILDINAKTGLYPLFVATSLYYKGMQEEIERNAGKFDPVITWQRILKENIYACAKTPMAKRITERTLTGYQTYKTNVQYIDNLVPLMKQDTKRATETIKEAFNHVKFDVIIGNPPYQEESIGESTQSPQLYHLFMDASYELCDRVCLITPAKFLFNAGATPKDWNKKMLNDSHLKVCYFVQDSSQIFPNTDIKGGVAITYRDTGKDFGNIGLFTLFEELTSTLQKVLKVSQVGLDTIMYGQNTYKFTDTIHQEHPTVKERLSVGHEYDLTTNIFEKLPDIFLDNCPGEGYVQIYGREFGNRTYKWIKASYIMNNRNFNKNKVFVPAANGTGAIGEVLSAPLIGEPLIGATQTFVSIGNFDTRLEADNAMKYIKTKFARAMLGVLKATQHNPPAKWKYVPLQDFTSNSDIDWTQSIAEIDQQLYRKYKLSPEEVAFIEEKVKAMD